MFAWFKQRPEAEDAFISELLAAAAIGDHVTRIGDALRSIRIAISPGQDKADYAGEAASLLVRRLERDIEGPAAGSGEPLAAAVLGLIVGRHFASRLGVDPGACAARVVAAASNRRLDMTVAMEAHDRLARTGTLVAGLVELLGRWVDAPEPANYSRLIAGSRILREKLRIEPTLKMPPAPLHRPVAAFEQVR
jgi:hypothetical protein